MIVIVLLPYLRESQSPQLHFSVRNQCLTMSRERGEDFRKALLCSLQYGCIHMQSWTIKCVEYKWTGLRNLIIINLGILYYIQIGKQSTTWDTKGLVEMQWYVLECLITFLHTYLVPWLKIETFSSYLLEFLGLFSKFLKYESLHEPYSSDYDQQTSLHALNSKTSKHIPKHCWSFLVENLINYNKK